MEAQEAARCRERGAIVKRKQQRPATDSTIMWAPRSGFMEGLGARPTIDRDGFREYLRFAITTVAPMDWDTCAWKLKVLDKTIEYVEAKRGRFDDDIHIVNGLERAAGLPRGVVLDPAQDWILNEICALECRRTHSGGFLRSQIHYAAERAWGEVFKFAWLYLDAWEAVKALNAGTLAWYQANLNCKRCYIGLVHWESAKNGFEHALAMLDKREFDAFLEYCMCAYKFLKVIPSCQDFARLLQPHEVIH